MSGKTRLGEFAQERGEFAQERGERSTPGQSGVYGLPPVVGETRTGPAPPDVRQVLSTYDSRPIGGYDFCLAGSFSLYGGTPEVTQTVPFGYVAVVRRIEVEASPAIIAAGSMQWIFSSGGVQAAGWAWNMGAILSERGIDVFFPVGSNQTMQLREVSGSLLSPAFTTQTDVFVRFIGNLILDTAIPVTQQVGTAPASVIVVSSSVKQS